MKPPTETFEELWRTDMKVLSWGVRYDRLVKYFSKVDNIESRFVNVEYDENEDVRLKLYKMLQESPDEYVFIYRYGTIYTRIYELHKSKYRKFYRSKESLPNYYASVWYLNSFPYKEAFNRKITLIKAMGIQGGTRLNISGKIK